MKHKFVKIISATLIFAIVLTSKISSPIFISASTIIANEEAGIATRTSVYNVLREQVAQLEIVPIITINGEVFDFSINWFVYEAFFDNQSNLFLPIHPSLGNQFGRESSWTGMDWESNLMFVEITRGNTSVMFTHGMSTYVVIRNFEEPEVRTMSVPAYYNAIPIFYLVEALGAELTFDATTNTLNVCLPHVVSTVEISQPRVFDMYDRNVLIQPIFATARSALELQSEHVSWRSAEEAIARSKREHHDALIDGMTGFEWGLMQQRLDWVNNFMEFRNLSIEGMTDYEKTAIIWRIIDEGLLEEFINIWEPNFRIAGNPNPCVPLARGINSLMVALDFELFRTVGGRVYSNTPRPGVAHAWNAYWDSTVGAVRFLDAQRGFGVWNLFVDELDERGFTLRHTSL